MEVQLRFRRPDRTCRSFTAQRGLRKIEHPGFRVPDQCHLARVDRQRQQSVCKAAETEDSKETEVSLGGSPSQESTSGNFVPVAIPEELPKGYRKNVRVNGIDILLLWYRNQIYAIEARSPAEGAYSEGFMNARLNQEYCIACPSTGTLFSLKTGEIVEWYPNNPVLKVITPRATCRDMDVYPVKLTQEAISVDVTGASRTSSVPRGKGGADSSVDNNNVFSDDSRPYYEGQDPDTGEIDEDVLNRVNPYVIGVSFFAVVFAGVAGSAYALYKESYIGLGALWVGIVGVAAYSIVNYTPVGRKLKQGSK